MKCTQVASGHGPSTHTVHRTDGAETHSEESGESLTEHKVRGKLNAPLNPQTQLPRFEA